MRKHCASLSLVIVTLCSLCAACSSSDEDGGGGAEQPDAGYGASYTVDWGPVTVEPLEEDTRCVVVRVGNDAPIKVGKFVNQLGAGSHHLIVYRVADQTERPEPFPCDPFQDVLDPTQGAPLAITQKAEETIVLPPGVAYSLEANQMIRIEMHFINTGEQPIEARASTTFVEIPEADFRDEADFLFVGNVDVKVPPKREWTLGPRFLPLPAELSGIHIFAITGHEHQWGTGVEVAMGAGEDAPQETIYAPDPFRWNEPETIYHDPPLAMPAGGGFTFSCDYYNLTDEEVGFGESANDEMCFFWAYYYPSVGAKVCAHTDEYGGQNLCCPGSPLCEYLDQL
jgi:hypothetical protein